MKFEDGPYYIGGKNRVDEMWACMNDDLVLNDMNCEVGWYIVLVVFLNCCRHWLFLPCATIPKFFFVDNFLYQLYVCCPGMVANA